MEVSTIHSNSSSKPNNNNPNQLLGRNNTVDDDDEEDQTEAQSLVQHHQQKTIQSQNNSITFDKTALTTTNSSPNENGSMTMANNFSHNNNDNYCKNHQNNNHANNHYQQQQRQRSLDNSTSKQTSATESKLLINENNKIRTSDGRQANYEREIIIQLIGQLLDKLDDEERKQSEQQKRSLQNNDCKLDPTTGHETIANNTERIDANVHKDEAMLIEASSATVVNPISPPSLANSSTIITTTSSSCPTPTITASLPTTEILSVSVPTQLESEETKEMAVLKNLEITPPPSSTANQPTKTDVEEETEGTNLKRKQIDSDETTDNNKGSSVKRRKSKLETADQEAPQPTPSGRARRQRTQTQLFQAGTFKASTNANTSASDSYSLTSDSPDLVRGSETSAKKMPRSGRKKSTTSSTCSEANLSLIAQETVQHHPMQQQPQHQPMNTNDLPTEVIFYEKNDYLAIRNEENSFYLCQLTENVKVIRPMIKIRWLDTKDGGKTYFLTSHYDRVPQKSILMPVSLNKIKGEKKNDQLFTLDDQDKDNVMERLKRSLNVAPQISSSQESSTS